jgi:hypothetical protein
MSQTTTTLHSFISCRPSFPLLSYLRPPSVIGAFLSHYSVGMGATSPTVTSTCTLACTMPRTHNHLYSHLHHSAGASATSPTVTCTCTLVYTMSHTHDHSYSHLHSLSPFRLQPRSSHMYLHAWCSRPHSFICIHSFTHSLSHSHTNVCTMTCSIRHIITATRSQVSPASRSHGWRVGGLDLGHLLMLGCALVILWSLFYPILLLPLSFPPSLHYLLWKLWCHRWPFRMWSASPANVPLLTVFIFGSVEACHWHYPESLVAKADIKI